MNDSAKKIMVATLVLTLGWTLSWPFRKTVDLTSLSTTNLSERSAETDRQAVQQMTSTATTIASGNQDASTMIHSSQKTRHTSQEEGSIPVADHNLHSIRQPHSISPSRRLQIHRPDHSMVVSQTGLAPISSDPKQNSSHSQLPPVSGSQAFSGLPLQMPGHYESGYSFPKPIPPKPSNSLSAIEEMQPRPAYATNVESLLPAEQGRPVWPQEIFHEIQNSDTLEKLAKRYLGDPTRALEIFDFNRDKLKNPEILPIGAELRIPAKG